MDEIQEEISDAFDDAFPACDGECSAVFYEEVWC